MVPQCRKLRRLKCFKIYHLFYPETPLQRHPVSNIQWHREKHSKHSFNTESSKQVAPVSSLLRGKNP